MPFHLSLSLIHLDIPGGYEVLPRAAQEAAYKGQGQVPRHHPRKHHDHDVTPCPQPAQSEEGIDYEHGKEGDGAKRDHLLGHGAGDVEVFTTPPVDVGQPDTAKIPIPPTLRIRYRPAIFVFPIERPGHTGEVLRPIEVADGELQALGEVLGGEDALVLGARLVPQAGPASVEG